MAPLCPNSPFLQPRASQCGPGVLQRNRRPGRLPRPHPTSPPFPSQGDMAALLSSQRFMPDFYSCYFPSLSFSVQFTLFKAQPRHCPAVPPGRAGLWSESGFLWSHHHPWLPMSHLGSSEQALNPAPTPRPESESYPARHSSSAPQDTLCPALDYPCPCGLQLAHSHASQPLASVPPRS